MKIKTFTTVLSSIALLLGFSSCGKDCDECFRYTDDFGTTYSYCKSNLTETIYNGYKAFAQTEYAATYEEFEECD